MLVTQGGGMRGESRSELTIAGSPKPPLSLAFTASGTSSSVVVPLLVEHVAVTSK
jgi:hypothetical protein